MGGPDSNSGKASLHFIYSVLGGDQLPMEAGVRSSHISPSLYFSYCRPLHIRATVARSTEQVGDCFDLFKGRNSSNAVGDFLEYKNQVVSELSRF